MNCNSLAQTVYQWIRGLSIWTRRTPLCQVIQAGVARLHRRRVPVMRQLSMAECGAACLAMMLNYYGRQISVSTCCESCGIGRDGLTAQTMAQAARHFGLRVKAYSLEPTDFPYVRLPAIIHWNFNHFVVVERWSPTGVEIVDPAVGRCRVTTEEFDASFTGVVLTFEPGVSFERRHATVQPLWRRYLRQMLQIPATPGVLAQILAASLLLQVLGLALPLFTKVVVDYVLPFHTTNMMTILGSGMMLVVLTQMVTAYLRSVLLIALQARLDGQTMLSFFEHVLTLPFRFFQQRTSGDLLMRLGSTMIIREALTSQTVSAVLDGSFVLVSLAILLVREPAFGALACGIGVLQIALLLGTTRRVRDLMRHDLATQAESHSYLVEALAGIATLKATGAEERALDHWSNLFFRHLNVSVQRSHLSAMIDTAMVTLRTFAPLILLWVGAVRVLHDSMSLGTMLALNALATAFLTPLASLVANGQRLQLVGAHLDRLADVWEAEPEQALHGVQQAPRLTGRIELRQVSFRYDPHAPWVLRDLSATVEPGQKIALVGRTASGKSTLARLLLGLYTPTAGEIHYDGIPLQCLNYRTLRRQFGVVLQEPFLFSGSIRQNIAFHDPSLSLEHVMEAAQQAAIHEEIMQMPMGYETMVAEGGAGLSGGQRQRLAIARALAQRPAMLLLDEATSHLDVATERVVDQNLSSLSCTRIVIAHRLSTIRNADLILVLDEGMIVERGSHRELLAQRGYYAALVHHVGPTQRPQLRRTGVKGYNATQHI